MSGDWEASARVLAAAVPALVAVLGVLRGPSGMRSRLKHDVEVLEKLPVNSAAHEGLLEHVATQVTALKALESPNSRRDRGMFVFSLLTTSLLGFAAVYLLQRGEWWSYILVTPTTLLAFFFVYGAIETGQRVPRDAKGKRLPSPTTTPQ